MKNLRSIFILLIVVLVPSMVSLAGDPLNFKDFTGPKDIIFGPVYTYSVLIEGSFEKEGIKWSATGGTVKKTWCEGDRCFCQSRRTVCVAIGRERQQSGLPDRTRSIHVHR